MAGYPRDCRLQTNEKPDGEGEKARNLRSVTSLRAGVAIMQQSEKPRIGAARQRAVFESNYKAKGGI
jgi:hypothetical protein